jgi:hypothetical protein
MIEKVAKIEFPKNVTHKPLKLNPSKNPRIPSPPNKPLVVKKKYLRRALHRCHNRQGHRLSPV